MRKPFWQLFSGKRKPIAKKQHCFKPRLEALEDRRCPAQLTNVWAPPPNYTDLLFSDYNDWSMGYVPTQSDPAIFDGKVSSLNCDLTMNATVDQLVFQNGYAGTLTIDRSGPGGGYDLSVLSGANLTNLDPATNTNATSNLAFADATSRLDLSGNNTFANFNFAGQNGEVRLLSGTLNVQSNRASTTTANFQIIGTLNLQNTATGNFTQGAWLNIAPGGVMNVSSSQIVMLNDQGTGGIIENWGTVNFTGVANTTTTIQMAFLTHGTVNLNGGGGISGTLAFTSAQTIDNGGFVMDSGNLNLSGSITLSQTTTAGYLQTGGTLSVTDNAQAWISSRNTAGVINGGVVQFTSGTGFGKLDLLGNWNWNGGTYTVRINGAQGYTRQNPNSDSIFVGFGNLAIAAGPTGPTLNILVQGALAQQQNWLILFTTGTINRTFPNVSIQNPGQQLRTNNSGLWLSS